jgi:hypothetical protein
MQENSNVKGGFRAFRVVRFEWTKMEIFVAGRMTLAIRSSTMMVGEKKSKGYSARYSKIIKE